MPIATSPPAPLESTSAKNLPSAPESTVPLWRCGVLLALAVAMIGIAWLNPALGVPLQSGVVLELPNVVSLALPDRPEAQFYGSKQPISEGELGILPADTEIVRKQYDDFRGHESILCTVLLSGAEQRSIHRAEVCLPGQGWTIVGQGNVPIMLDSGHKLMVRNLAIQRDLVSGGNEHRAVHAFFMYWFVGEDTTTPSQFMRVFLSSWDRILYNRAHRWAYIMVMSAVTNGMQPGGLDGSQTQSMMTEFIRKAVPSFQKSEMPKQTTP